jgi:hypothetical protein
MAIGEVAPKRLTVVETRTVDGTGTVKALEGLAATANSIPISFQAQTIFERIDDEEIRREI